MDPLEGVVAVLLDRVLQERDDRGGLVATILEDKAGDDHQVREIRDLGTRAPLPAMKVQRELERGEQAVTELS